MALARNFERITFKTREPSEKIGERIYKPWLTTSCRMIDVTIDESDTLGISFETDIRRVRIRATRDIREMPEAVTHASIRDQDYGVVRKLDDTQPGFIDVFLQTS